MFPDVEEQVIEADSTLIITCTINDRKILTTSSDSPFWSIPQMTRNKKVNALYRYALPAFNVNAFFSTQLLGHGQTLEQNLF